MPVITALLELAETYPRYGFPKYFALLRSKGHAWNHKRVHRIYCELNLHPRLKGKRRHFFGKSGSSVFPDLLGRNFAALLPGRKFATDITCLPTTDGFIYLSVVFAMLDKLSATPGAVLHSDHGFQYTYKSHHERLNKLQLHGSHSRKGNCLDNACVESFFSHLKTEAFAGQAVMNKGETISLVAEHIRLYNTERFQKRLDQLSR